MRFAPALLLTVAAAAAEAYPGIGIVVDSRGNVFYTDLRQVWRIAPSGARSVAVPNVHTHELCLDANDNLYGEHLWYEGERTDKWGHYVWMRSPDGRIATVIPRSEGFLQNYSFVRDQQGNMYWADRPKNAIMKRASDGTITLLARAPFRDVRWMMATPDGTVYLIDSTDLVRVTQGEVRTIARRLSHVRLRWPLASERHLVMGLWTDAVGNIYIADYAGGEVKRVTPAGRVSVAFRSRWPWSPTGGTFAPNGDLWLLEYSIANEVRVRRVARNGRETTFPATRVKR